MQLNPNQGFHLAAHAAQSGILGRTIQGYGTSIVGIDSRENIPLSVVADAIAANSTKEDDSEEEFDLVCEMRLIQDACIAGKVVPFRRKRRAKSNIAKIDEVDSYPCTNSSVERVPSSEAKKCRKGQRKIRERHPQYFDGLRI